MKKQIRQISKIAGCMMASVLISGIYFPSHAQTEERIAFKNSTWEIAYRIMIKGKGTEEPELGSGGPDITWSVDRLYSGQGKLVWRSENEHVRTIYDKRGGYEGTVVDTVPN